MAPLETPEHQGEHRTLRDFAGGWGGRWVGSTAWRPTLFLPFGSRAAVRAPPPALSSAKTIVTRRCVLFSIVYLGRFTIVFITLYPAGSKP